MIAVVHAPGVAAQISRAVMTFVLVTAVMAAAPHLLRLSAAVAVFGCLAIGWRALSHFRAVPLPRTLFKLLMMAAGVAVVLATMRNPFGLEPAVALLVVTYLLKLLETVTQRDGYIVIFLAYFIAATLFLFDQSSATAAYVIAACLLSTAALAAQAQSVSTPRVWQGLLVAARLLALSVPVAALVFLLFPRVGPLWSVPLPGITRTGLTEEMSPHLISQLTQSGDVAFRVNFQGVAPPARELYWRAVVYYEVSGGTWRQGLEQGQLRRLRDFVDWNDDSLMPEWRREPAADTASYRYRVIAEPSGRPWLYALAAPESLTTGIGLTRDQRLLHREAPNAKVAYDVVSRPELPPDLPDWLRERALQLPEAESPRARALAASMRAASRSDSEVVARVLDLFREQDFHYTLTPPALAGSDVVDQFLFESRHGVCGHYAGAFAFLMRAAGIPARVVGGYQGGDVNALGDFMTIHQYDAHAWVEVWVEAGWRRVDPTAAVAPSRIERGIEALTGDRSGLFANPWGLRQLQSMALMLSLFDSFEHHWNMWVVGYDTNVQTRMLARWFGTTNWRWLAAGLIAGVAALLMAYVLAGILVDLRRRPRPASTALAMLAACGASLGVARAPHETPSQYGERLAAALPRHREVVAGIVDDINTALYVTASDRRLERRARRAARRLRLQVAVQYGTSS